MAEKTKTIEELVTEYHAAVKDYAEAEEEARVASANESAKRRRLSELQKEIDACIASMRDESPWDTPWHDARCPGLREEVRDAG